MRKFDQCVEIAGDSARGWRRPPTEHRDEPRHGKQKRLREFIKVDNERALDVGELRRGTGTFKVRQPKGGSDVTVRETPDELTLRAEEVNTWKVVIDVKHINPE